MKKNILLHRTILITVATLLAGCATPPSEQQASTEPPASSLASLPETVTSFGAVTANGWLYVFGGHKGDRHDYNIEMVSGSFHRLKLAAGQPWEHLPAAPPAQGVPLVTHDRFVYRIGGMAARNQAGTKQDLYSMNIVQRFDIQRARWEEFAPLPAPRSSHDAVVIGDKIYVAGGWQLTGGTNKAAWPKAALVFDLAHPDAGWREFPQPFQRRALALAALGTRIFCIGGMDSDNQPTLAVDIYNTTSGQWTKGPDLPAGKFKGFSCSAIAQDGRIYVTAFQGDLLQLSPDALSWQVAGRLQHPRMAHRLVTAGTTQLVVLGGEDGDEKRPDLELLNPAATPSVLRQAITPQSAAANAK